MHDVPWCNFDVSVRMKMRKRETDRTKANCTQYTDRIRRIGGRKGGHWEAVKGA